MKKLAVQLDQFAYGLEKELELCLKPYKRGVYRAGREAPTLLFPEENGGQPMAWSLERRGGRLIKKPITCPDDVRGEIVDVSGTTLLPNAITANRSRFLSPKPTVPAYSRSILFASVCGFISDISEFDNGSNDNYLVRAYQEFITRGYLEYVDFYDIVKGCDCELLNQIREFTGSTTWSIFEPKREGSNLFIEDLGDYRIFEWESRNGGRELERSNNALHRLFTGCS